MLSVWIGDNPGRGARIISFIQTISVSMKDLFWALLSVSESEQVLLFVLLDHNHRSLLIFFLHPDQPSIIPFITVTNPAMPTSTTHANCTHPSLPPFQSLMTDPSSPGIDNEEVAICHVRCYFSCSRCQDAASLCNCSWSLHASCRCKHACCCWQWYRSEWRHRIMLVTFFGEQASQIYY